jgi:hypothetical protein
MAVCRRALLALSLLVPAASLAGLPGPLAEDREQNRRALAVLQLKEPDEYARLRQEARAFLDLPEEHRQRLIRLDRDLQGQPPPVRDRLVTGLRRYAEWLEALPEQDRQAIREAPDGRERLRRIREVRERQWRQGLPRAVREELQGLHGQALAERVARLREEERQRRRDWKVALRFWETLMKRRAHGQVLPSRLADLEAADLTYVQQVLRPLLSREEWQEVEQAQGQWPRYPRLLVALADRHPPALDGPRGPTRLTELPGEVQQRLVQHVKKELKRKGGLLVRLKAQEGQWPGFAAAVTRLPRAGRGFLPPDFWPSRREDLSGAVKKLLEMKLEPTLDGAEKALLRKAEGHWPAFPRTIQDLAVRHALSVPWQTLPGSRTRWENYRLEQPAAEDLPAARKHKRRAAARAG